MSPFRSDDLTVVIGRHPNGFAVYRSPESAGHMPDYHLVGIFPTLDLAEAYKVEADGARRR